MAKKNILLSIPLSIAAGLLIYCWVTIFSTNILATWRHYIALVLFIILIVLYFKSYKLTVMCTGVYFLLATFNLLSMTAIISTSGIRIGPVLTPPIQLLSLGLFILFAILNLDSLINIYLDYMEAKSKSKL